MNITQEAALLIKEVTTDYTAGFGTAVTFTTPDGLTTVICGAIAIRHSIAINEYNAPVKGTTARVTVSESALKELGYPTRDVNNRISLLTNKVSWVDVDGNTNNFIITELFPGNTNGIIVCTLGIFN